SSAPLVFARNVVVRSRAGAVDFAQQVFEIARVADEIYLRAIDHQQRGLVVVDKKVAVRGRHALQVLQADMPLEAAVALAQPIGEDLDAGANINHQVWLGELSIEQAIDTLVEHQFVGVEVETGEDSILGKQVVGHGRLREEVL